MVETPGAEPTSLEERIAAALGRKEFDQAATEALRGYGPEILRYALTLCRSPDDAKDVFAEFAERLWKALRKLQAPTVRALAYRLVRNAAADFYSDAYRRRRITLPSSLGSRLAESIHRTTMASLKRHADRLARIRANLTPEEKTLLLLRLDHRLSWEEIADVLGGEQPGPDAATLRKRFERLKAKIGRKAREADLLDAPGLRSADRTRGPGPRPTPPSRKP